MKAEKKGYYNNSHYCGECTGAGCKHCYDTTGLRMLGTVRFPLSLGSNNAKPPMIAHSYKSVSFKAEAKKARTFNFYYFN